MNVVVEKVVPMEKTNEKLKSHAIKEVTMLLLLAHSTKNEAAASSYKERANSLAKEWDVQLGDISWDYGAWVSGSL